MRKLLIIIALLALIYYLGGRIMHEFDAFGLFERFDLPATLILSGANLEETRDSIIEYVRTILPNDASASFDPEKLTLETTYVDINNDDLKDLLIIFKSHETCGTAGCLSSIFLQDDTHAFEPLAFSYAVTSIAALDSFTGNMRDLIVNNTSQMTWSGQTYVLDE